MTNETERIPAATIHWVAPAGAVRRATLSTLRNRRYWIRALLIGAIVGVIAAALCIAADSGWALGLLIGCGFFAGLTLELLLVCLWAAQRQNRTVLRDGARWAAGSDAERIRIDTPVLTLVIARANIESVRRMGALVVITVRPKHVVAAPVALLPAIVTDPGLAHLIE